MRLILIIFATVFVLSCSGSPNTNSVVNKTPSPSPTKSGPAPVYTYEVVKSYPHDPKAFTEGLFYYDGYLYESTGETGRSSLRKVEIETGKVVQKFDLPPESFGEGISIWNNMIYQLTWQEGICRVFDAKDFTLIRELEYQGQGWGMTTDGTN